MTVKADYGQVKVQFEIDGTEESTVDWEMPSWSVKEWFENDIDEGRV